MNSRRDARPVLPERMLHRAISRMGYSPAGQSKEGALDVPALAAWLVQEESSRRFRIVEDADENENTTCILR